MRTQTFWIGMVALGLILAAGLFAPVVRTEGPISTEDDFTVVTLNACWLFDGIGEER